ncbi:flagella basal body P-ring formation protein FlgA, partial [Arsenophonus nasoniae]
SEEILTGTKHNKSIPSPFCNKGWLLLLTLKAIQFPNHQGRHFQLKYEGKAINNAAENESVRLKMPTGQIITAIAQKEGYAKITLKN